MSKGSKDRRRGLQKTQECPWTSQWDKDNPAPQIDPQEAERAMNQALYGHALNGGQMSKPNQDSANNK